MENDSKDSAIAALEQRLKIAEDKIRALESEIINLKKPPLMPLERRRVG